MELIEEKYKQTEVGLIPSDWEVKTLGDLGEVKMCRRIFNNETSPNGSIPFFKIGTFGKEPDAFISKDQYDEYRKRFSFPRKGDILISAAGTIGRTIIYDGEDAYFQDSNIVWIENNFETVSNEFLYHIYQVANYNTEGGTIQRLYNSILKATKFKCPPKAEQTAIAIALSDTDALISSLEKLIAKKRNIKQGAMQKLLQPKEGWEVKKLGEIGKCHRGVSYNPERDLHPHDKNVTVRLLRSNNVQNQNIDLNGLQFVDQERVKPNQLLQDNDIVICMANGSKQLVGKSAIFKVKDKLNYTFGAFMGCFRTNIDLASSSYIALNFQSFQYRNYIDVLLSGSSINNLNPGNIESIEIPFPPAEEQTRIATILSDMGAEIHALEIKLEKYRKVKLGMMQNLLTGKIRLV